MPNKTIHVDALCPFFCTESVKTLTCEGIVGTTTVTKFSYTSQKVKHEKKYCTCNYDSCPIYKANMSKY